MLPDPKDEWDESRKWREYFYSLFMDFSWIARRVETVTSVDLEHWDHKVSIDLDVIELRKRAKTCGLLGYSKLPIPVDTICKGLIVEFDLVGQDGRPMSIETSDDDSRVAQLALLGHKQFLNDSNLPAQEIIDLIYEIALDMKIRRDWEKPEFFNENWQAIIADDSFKKLLQRFSRNFPIVVNINTPDSRSDILIKYRYVEVAKYKSRLPSFRYCSKPLVYQNPRTGEAQREHLHIKVPDGVAVSSIPMLIRSEIKPEENKGDAMPPQEPRFYVRATPAQVSFYSKATINDSDKYSLFCLLRPKLEGFVENIRVVFSLSLIIVLSLFIWAMCGQHIGFFDSFRFSEQGVGVMPVITILQFLPTLLLLKILNDEKDTLRKRMLLLPRGLALFSLVLTTLSCVFIIAEFPFILMIWIAVLLVDCLGAIVTLVYSYRTSVENREIMENMHKTFEMQLFDEK